MPLEQHPDILRRRLERQIQQHNPDFKALLAEHGALSEWQSLIKAERTISEAQAEKNIAYHVKPHTVIEKTREMNLLAVVDLLLTLHPELLQRWCTRSGH